MSATFGLEIITLQITWCVSFFEDFPETDPLFLRRTIVHRNRWKIVDAREVAAGSLVVAEQEEIGHRYLLAAHSTKMRDLFQAMERVSGQKNPVRSLLSWLLFGIAGVQEVYARITGKPALLSLAAVRVMAVSPGASSFRKMSAGSSIYRFDLLRKTLEKRDICLETVSKIGISRENMG